VPGGLGEHLLLDLHLLDHRLDHEVDAAEPLVVQGRVEERHLAPRLGGLQAVALHGLVEEPGGVGHAGGERLLAQVLHAHRKVGLAGDQVGDAAAHHPGAEHRNVRHLARLAAGQPRLALGPLGQVEDVHQVFRDLRRGELRHGAGLGVEAGAHAVLDPHPHHLDGAKRRRVVAARRLQRLLAHLVEQHLAADRVLL
jgi:hypothetical protein